MIALASTSTRQRLFPVCIVKRCRSVATEHVITWHYEGQPDVSRPTLCQRCAEYYDNLPSEKALEAGAVWPTKRQRRRH